MLKLLTRAFEPVSRIRCVDVDHEATFAAFREGLAQAIVERRIRHEPRVVSLLRAVR
ncbi:MAG: hypothetical protein AAGD34_06415 [Pseudomonadota bacterium]